MNQAAHQLMGQAAAFFRQGRYEECAKVCQRLLQKTPKHLDSLHMLAQAAQRGGAYELSDAAFRELVALAPTRSEFLVNYAMFLRARGRPTEAENCLRQATKAAPKAWSAWHGLGLVLFEKAEFPEAERCANRAIELDGSKAGGWELAAAVAQKTDQPESGIRLCQEGLKRVPDAARLHYALGQFLRQECRFAAAAEAYVAAVKNGYAPPELYRYRSEALLDSGDMDAALECAVAGVERHPGHPGLLRTAARLQFSSGASGDPIQRIRAAARSEPGNPALWVTQVDLLKRLNRHEEASAAFREARRLGCPSSLDLLVLEAQDAGRAGDTAQAKRLFEDLLRHYPDNTQVQISFATQMLANGEPNRAEKLCAAILDRDPFDQLALAYLGTAWQLMDDDREHWLLDYERMVIPVEVPAPDDFANREQFFEALSDALEGLHHTHAQPIEQSVRGGTQTNGFLFRLKHPLLATLELQIRKAIVSACERFPEDQEHPFWVRKPAPVRSDALKFAGAWSVRLRDQGYHANHIHPQGWISSALYIALPDEVTRGEGDAGYIQFGSPLEELGLGLPPRRTVKPSVGTLVLFPSYMWHGTLPFHSEQPRITVAFDLLP